MTDQTSPTRLVRFLALGMLLLLAALLRVVPHPANVTSVGALAIFGGATIANRRAALLLPLTCLAVGDLILGWHVMIPVVYGSFALNVFLSRLLRNRPGVLPLAGVTFLGSIQFFLTTNFASWWIWYPHTAEGLAECFVAGMPYFRNTLAGDLGFTAGLFAALALAERLVPSIRDVPEPASAS